MNVFIPLMLGFIFGVITSITILLITYEKEHENEKKS